MKLVYLLIISILLTSCVKNGITPVAAKTPAVTVKKADSVKVSSTGTTANNDVDYNGTTGSAILQVTCTNCTAIAMINNVGTPFAFNAQGVGELRYTPTPGTSVYIAVCPGSVKAMKVDIFDAAHNSLFSYAGTTGNWNNTYVIK